MTEDLHHKTALFLIQQYLKEVFSGNKKDINDWLSSPNEFLSGVPQDLMTTLSGAIAVRKHLAEIIFNKENL